MTLIKRYPFVSFVVLAYAISWTLWTPLVIFSQDSRMFLILGTFGPTLSALLLTFINHGRADLRALLRRLFIWRVSIFWYLFSFLLPAIIVLLAIGLHVLLGGAVPEFRIPAQWYLVIPVFLYVLFFSVLGEEIGWRGYALPELQANPQRTDGESGHWCHLGFVACTVVVDERELPPRYPADPVHASDHRFFNHLYMDIQ